MPGPIKLLSRIVKAIAEWVKHSTDLKEVTSAQIEALGLPDVYGGFAPVSLMLGGGLQGGAGGAGLSPLTAYKSALSKLFADPKCAELLGGQERATSVLNGMSVLEDARTNPTSGGPQTIAIKNAVITGNAFAGTVVPRESGGAWSGAPYATYVAEDFTGQSTMSSQLTILIHEMMHVSAGRQIDNFMELANGRISASIIHNKCGTAFPEGVPDVQ